MTTVTHASLTGADLHEPKGVAAAASGSVYVANGTGSGTWTDASSIIANTAWSTGDAKITLKTTADSGWVMCDDGTIGDASSGGTTRANADTSALYTLLWTNFSNTNCPVTGGRGASAAADFAAHKPIKLPLLLGRALAISGSGSGLTARSLGDTVGAEKITLAQSDLPNIHQSVTITDPGHTHGTNPSTAYVGNYAGSVSLNNVVAPLGQATLTIYSATTGISAAFYLNGNVTQTTPSLMQPTSFLNIMVKL